MSFINLLSLSTSLFVSFLLSETIYLLHLSSVQSGINDVNREIAKDINPAAGHAQHLQQNDADKIEKYLILLRGGFGTLFYDAKMYLIRSNDAGQLTWALMTAEIERARDNIKSDEQKASARKVSQVSIGKSYEDGLREGSERNTAAQTQPSQ